MKWFWSSANLVGLMLVSIILSGCSANYNSIHRVNKIPAGETRLTLIDAKQRAIITGSISSSTTYYGADGKISASEQVSRPQFCTEPPPDVFSVFASAFSGNASLGKKADPASLDASIAAAVSSAEQGSTIPRTQTTNSINYMMYNTCLRGLDGWIGDLEMPIQAARDQRSALSLLAVEQLTGVIMPTPIVIGASSSAASANGAGEAAVRLDNAWQALQTAQASADAAKRNSTALEATEPKCSALKVKAAAAPLTDAAEIAKNQKCVDAASVEVNAKTALAQVTEHYDALKATLKNGATGDTASATVTPITPPAPDNPDRGTQIAAVASKVADIVALAYNQDETQLFCIRILGDRKSGSQSAAVADNGPRLVEACLEYLVSKTNLDTSSNLQILEDLNPERADQLRKQYRLRTQAFETFTQSQFDRFWNLVSSAANADFPDATKMTGRLSPLIKKYGADSYTANILRALQSARSRKEAAEGGFQDLDNKIRNLLIQP